MEGQTIIKTQDVDELLISTVVRLIQRRAFPNLRNIIVRAIGEVSIKDTWRVLWREFSTGALLGITYGVLLGGFAGFFPHFREYAWKLPLVVALAIFVNMIIAATVGIIIPMFFKRVHIDPAVATGPFVTTAVDVIGIFTYFLLANVFLF